MKIILSVILLIGVIVFSYITITSTSDQIDIESVRTNLDSVQMPQGSSSDVAIGNPTISENSNDIKIAKVQGTTATTSNNTERHIYTYTITVPPIFAPLVQEGEIKVTKNYFISKYATPQQKKEREKYLLTLMLSVYTEMKCGDTVSECAQVHISGPCGGSDLVIKKQFTGAGVDFYNALNKAWMDEFMPIFEC